MLKDPAAFGLSSDMAGMMRKAGHPEAKARKPPRREEQEAPPARKEVCGIEARERPPLSKPNLWTAAGLVPRPATLWPLFLLWGSYVAKGFGSKVPPLAKWG